MRSRSTVAALLAFALLGAASANARAGGAVAADIQEAIDLAEAREHDEARDALDSALRAGRHGRADTVRIYRLAGEVAAALGDPAAAEQYFTRMLVIDPAARPRRVYAPAVGPSFDRAMRAASSRGALRVRVQKRGDGGVLLEVVADPLNMVAAAWAHYRDAEGIEREVLIPSGGKTVLPMPDKPDSEPVDVGVTDEFGNRLAETRLAAPRGAVAAMDSDSGKAREIGGAAAGPSEAGEGTRRAGGGGGGQSGDSDGDGGTADEATGQQSGRPWIAQWELWGSLAAVSAGTAVYFGMQASDAQDDAAAYAADSANHSYDEVLAAEDRGRRNALYTNISIGAAAACAVTAGVLIFWPKHDKPGDKAGARQALRIAPVPMRGGGTVHVALEF
jgi:hypothetical protein